MFGSTGFIHQQATHQDDVCARFPAVLVARRHLLHVFEEYGQWKVWLNTEDMEFTGLCVGVGATREAAVAQAMEGFTAAITELQKPA